MSFLNYIRRINLQTKILFLIFFDFFLILCSTFLTEIIYLGYVPQIANALFLYVILAILFIVFFFLL